MCLHDNQTFENAAEILVMIEEAKQEMGVGGKIQRESGNHLCILIIP